MVTIIIYKLENKINNKVYIGQTIQKLNRRITDHVLKSKKVGKKTVFSAALKKYGIENFNITILDKATSKDELNSKEILWISKYNSVYPNGYNMDKGGNSRSWNELSRKKLSESKIKSEKQIRVKVFKFDKSGHIVDFFRDTKTARENGIKIPMKNILESKTFAIEKDGFIYTTKKELFYKFLKKKKLEVDKEIIYFDKNGKTIGKYKTTLDMERKTKKTNTGISLVLRGKQKVFEDYSFVLYSSAATIDEINNRLNYTMPKAVKKIRMFNDNVDKVFENATMAQKVTGINRQLIAMACKKKSLYKGYNWEYV